MSNKLLADERRVIITLTLDPKLLAAVDAMKCGDSRSEAVNKLIQIGLDTRGAVIKPETAPDPNTITVTFQPTLLQLLHASASTNNKSVEETINDKLKWSYGMER